MSWNGREQYRDPEERRQLQLEQLQVTANRVYKNVPFYRNRFRKIGVGPTDIASLEDLSRLPFTRRVHFSDHYPYGLFAVPLRDIVRIHTAPGTGGNPTVSGYTCSDLQLWRSMISTALSAAGVGRDDILQIILEPGLANWARDYKDAAEDSGVSVIPMGLLHLEKQLMVLRDYKTSVLITTPTFARQLADLLFRMDLNPNGLALRSVILVGEPAGEKSRKVLEDELHVTSWIHYGLSEIPGPAMAFECEVHDGLHVHEDHFLVEVLDPETLEKGEDGEGELVVTTLTARAFPLIRFRTGDRVRILDGTCPCGRTTKRIRWLQGRTDDLMLLGGVKIHRGQIARRIRDVLGFLPAMMDVEIKAEGLGKVLAVHLGMDDQLFSDEIKELERVIRTMTVDLQQEFGVPVRVTFRETGIEDRRM